MQEQITRVLLERLIVHRPHPVKCSRITLFEHIGTYSHYRYLKILTVCPISCNRQFFITAPFAYLTLTLPIPPSCPLSSFLPPSLPLQQWGLLITFIELIKNPRYAFWRRSFTHCAPELERVFESVARYHHI